MYIRVRCLLDVGFQSDKECGWKTCNILTSNLICVIVGSYSIFNLLGIVWPKSKLLGIGFALSFSVLMSKSKIPNIML